jgi:hypothetical protein
MQLTTHFSLAEFTVSQEATRKGISNQPDPAMFQKLITLAWHMENIRKLLGGPILISSAYRSPELNAAVGGSKTSSHMQGEAVDFICPSFGANRKVIDRLAATLPSWDQLILEFPNHSNGGWVHVGFGSRVRKQVLQYDGKTYSNLIDRRA